MEGKSTGHFYIGSMDRRKPTNRCEYTEADTKT
jgi:hypothetical protein